MKPLVSIIVPVYNVQSYVFECLDSLSQQNYENLEIIVVDDGSTDSSGKICDDFAKNERRMKLFHKKNGGLSSARNFGIKKACGDYICFVDSDDYVKKDFVKKMVKKAVCDDAEVVICGYNSKTPKESTTTGKEAAIKLLIEQDNMEIIAWNKMYRRELFNNILYPAGKKYEDNLTTYKLLSEAHLVTYLPESLYIYRERIESITNVGAKEEKLRAREEAAKEAINYFPKNTDLREAAEIADLTAKLAWIDFAISNEVSKKYLCKARKWIKNNKNHLLKNKFLSKKLKFYVLMVAMLEGKLYTAFRKVWHE